MRLITRFAVAATALIAASAAPAHAAAAPRATAAVAGPADARYRAGEVVVHFAAGTSAAERASAARSVGAGGSEAFAPQSRELALPAGASVPAAVKTLTSQPGVVTAAPNLIAKTSAYYPNDPGNPNVPGGWAALQWNFLPGAGLDMPDAWQNMINLKRPGGVGTTVAVLDTGVAYSNRGRFKISPDFRSSRFVRGYDFVSKDPYANDEYGHGTHVASTLGADTGEGIGLTGIAYGAKIMPVRVLDAEGIGDIPAIAAGIRYAAKRGVDVINLSFEFGSDVQKRDIPDVISALAYARHKNVLVVAASGNEGAASISYPARATGVLSVGATTQRGCLADYSNDGSGLGLVAPGGGPDAALPNDPACQPNAAPGLPIFQFTFPEAGHSVSTFGLPTDYIGTSMATPHVAGVAALVIASGILGSHPKPTAVIARLKATATDLGTPGYDSIFGAGLLNAFAATNPADARGR